jgi:cold shock protein
MHDDPAPAWPGPLPRHGRATVGFFIRQARFRLYFSPDAPMCVVRSFRHSTSVSYSAPVALLIDTGPGRRTLRAAHTTGDLTMANGTVKWFNATKGFGFIQPQGGSKDVFVHISALERAGLRALEDGQAVTFDLERDRQGRESAVNLALA